jgi:hypothetical protein
MKPKKAKARFPKTIGESIDRLYELTKEKQEAEAAVKLCDDAIATLREHVLKVYGVQKMGGARGTLAQCNITQPIVPNVEDWPTVYDWICKKPKERVPLLLHKRISTEAWRDLLDAGTPVPGTKAFTLTKLSLTAIATKGPARGKAKK